MILACQLYPGRCCKSLWHWNAYPTPFLNSDQRLIAYARHLLLSSYHCQIEFKSSAEVASADALEDASIEEENFFVATQQLKQNLGYATEFAKETSGNPIMAEPLLLIHDGWPLLSCADPQLKPYFTRKNEFL